MSVVQSADLALEQLAVVTLPRSLVASIARAVERAGGDMDDVRSLLEVWERLEADTRGRVDRMRAENRWRERAWAEREQLERPARRFP